MKWINFLNVLIRSPVPKKITKVLDKILLGTGFSIDKGLSNPLFYTIIIKYTDEIDKLFRYESLIEEKLSLIGFGNIRILKKPLRIEIDKSSVPSFPITMADLNVPINQMICVPGVTFEADALQHYRLQLSNDNFSCLVAGSPGSGKTQLALSMLLTLCWLNDPTHLKLYIADGKIIDTLPFAKLVHLPQPIMTDASEVLALTDELISIVDARLLLAKAGDNSFLKEVHLLFIDELSDIYERLSVKERKRFLSNIKRLTQIGRGLGICLLLATQRVFDLPKGLYSKLNLRIVGRVRDANDSFAATGQSKTLCNKLPGKGAFEVYGDGQRIQSFFVADPKDSDYNKELTELIDQINDRWR